MHIVLGGTGHVGSAVAGTLLDLDEPVTVVAHDGSRVGPWRDRGATVAIVDLSDVDAVRAVLATGHRAFLLNPPADPSTDTDVQERRTAAAIAAAVDGSGLDKVVAASTYGARPGERIGDLSVLYELEQALDAVTVPAAVNRHAYYMSNWDAMLPSARDDGRMQSMFDADQVIPMVAPHDLGVAAAHRLLEPPDDIGIRYIEGPARYTPRDVAHAYERALGRAVDVEVIAPEDRRSTFLSMGFSAPAADSYARMTNVSAGELDLPNDPERGTTTLEAYVDDLVRRSG